MSEWKEFLNEQLKDPKISEEWDALETEFAIAQAVIDARRDIKQSADRAGSARTDTLAV